MTKAIVLGLSEKEPASEIDIDCVHVLLKILMVRLVSHTDCATTIAGRQEIQQLFVQSHSQQFSSQQTRNFLSSSCPKENLAWFSVGVTETRLSTFCVLAGHCRLRTCLDDQMGCMRRNMSLCRVQNHSAAD